MGREQDTIHRDRYTSKQKMEEGCESSVKDNIEDEKAVMDTPERGNNNQIVTTVRKFEDSPVFTFLNNLSPIKPVKSTHITQAIDPLNFVSLPYIFASPHVNSPGESRFLRRHQFPDPSQPEFSSYDGNTVGKSKDMDAAEKLDDQHENLNPRNSHGEVTGRTFDESPKILGDKSENINYDHASSNSPLRPSCDHKGKHTTDYACASSALVYGSEVNLDRVCHTDQNKEATSCDRDSLIVDASDVLVSESPNDIGSDMQHMHLIVAVCSGQQVGEGSGLESLTTQPGEGSETIENAETCMTAGSLRENPSEKMDHEHLTGLYRGMRRRCLVFEIAGALGNNLDKNSAPNSSVLPQSDSNTSSNDTQLFPRKTTNESPLCIIPSMGLHLNALGTTTKDNKIVNHGASASGRLLIGPSSSFSSHPPTGQELLNYSSDTSVERENENIKDYVLPVEDACQPCGYVANEEINLSSPKKKRHRSEQAGEGEACKRCNCKKSKCLKLYCECFAAGAYCVEPCACIDCFNKPVHVETVLSTRRQIESRNPLAFAPKVIRGSDPMIETGDDSSNTPASARHKRGCNCKKSGCWKKYCECYQGGVGCSVNCRCEGCKNAFGRKEDGVEAEYEDETDTTEKSVLEKDFQKTALHNEQNMDSWPLATPLLTGRLPVKHLFSNKKPRRCSSPSISSPSSLYEPRLFQPPPKFDKPLETVEEDEIPKSLREGSPISDIKSSSPNSKRVSPPHNAGTSSGLRSSRKLILRSIPSFPSFAPNCELSRITDQALRE